MLKQITFGLVALMIASSPAAHAAQELEFIHTGEAKVGDQFFVKLPGNPRAGYKWRLNTGMSTGLELVDVNQLGWLMAKAEKSMFFQNQSVLNVSMTAKAAGEATLAFDYYRRMGGRMLSKTSYVKIRIKPRLASQ